MAEQQQQQQLEAFFELRKLSFDATSRGEILLGGHHAKDLLAKFGSPLVVYNEEVIRSQYKTLSSSFTVPDAETQTRKSIRLGVHYAMKANFNPTILSVLLQEGASIDAVSPLEVELALRIGFTPDRILFTGNNIGRDDLEYCLDKGISVNIESLYTLSIYGAVLDERGSKGTNDQLNREVSIRINPDIGAAHHHNCITGGPSSKFGIYATKLAEVFDVLQKYKLKLVGIHSHIGSGILDPKVMLQAMDIVLSIAEKVISTGKTLGNGDLVALKWIDFGGGFGIAYNPENKKLDVPVLANAMAERFQSFASKEGDMEMRIEPGRFLVAPSAVLLATVTNTKTTPDYHFVGIDSGMNHLIRPMLYGSYHHILNTSPLSQSSDETEVPYVVVGNICESGDVFTGQEGDDHSHNAKWKTRLLRKVERGDVLAVCDVGAYGIAMSSQYNLRSRPAEVLLRSSNKDRGETVTLIRRRETLDDMIAPCVPPSSVF